MERTLLVIVLAPLAAAIVAGPLPGGLDAPVAEAAPAEQFITAPGPLGPITVLGDSVLLGSLLYSPTLAEQLHQRGWGPVRMRAGEGSLGFDASRGEYVDLVAAGIIDPTKVVRSALENAVSVAGVLLLAEGTLTEIEDKTAERGPGVPELG